MRFWKQQNKKSNKLAYPIRKVLHTQTKVFYEGELSLLSFLGKVRKWLQTEKLTCQQEGKPRKFQIWQKVFEVLGDRRWLHHQDKNIKLENLV